MYSVLFSNSARKSLEKYARSGVFPQKKFRQALLCLREEKPLPVSFQDHQLKGSMSIYREFHLSYDLLVQYERDDILCVIAINKIGTHTEFFGR